MISEAGGPGDSALSSAASAGSPLSDLGSDVDGSGEVVFSGKGTVSTGCESIGETEALGDIFRCWLVDAESMVFEAISDADVPPANNVPCTDVDCDLGAARVDLGLAEQDRMCGIRGVLRTNIGVTGCAGCWSWSENGLAIDVGFVCGSSVEGPSAEGRLCANRYEGLSEGLC